MRVDGYEECLVTLQRTGYPDACETIPFRKVELQYAKWKAGLSRHRPNWKEDCDGTTVGLCRNPVYLLNWEVYSITHTLFYLTDFSGPATWIPDKERQRVGDMVEVLLVHYWRQKNWDLVGELLLNLLALNGNCRPLFALCAGAFLRAWRIDGAVPGPTFDAEVKSPNDDYIFKHCYHTTLVGLLLCGGYLHRSSDAGSQNASA
jgi:hypothetical protein